jgi:hypothetical protein
MQSMTFFVSTGAPLSSRDCVDYSGLSNVWQKLSQEKVEAFGITEEGIRD